MKYLLLCFLFLVGCSKSGSDEKPIEVDPIYGNWIYVTPGSNGQKGIVSILNKDGTISNTSFYSYSVTANSVKFYYRRFSGKFVRNGDTFDIKYDYETCDPVGTDVLNLKSASADKLYVNVPRLGLFLTFNRVPESTSPIDITAIEDKNCDILAKIEKKEKRSVASEKSKSFFDRMPK